MPQWHEQHNFTLLTFTVQPRNKTHPTVTQPDFSSACLSALINCSIQVFSDSTLYHRATQALRNHTSKTSEIKHGGAALLVSGQQVFRRRNYCLVFIRGSGNDTLQEAGYTNNNNNNNNNKGALPPEEQPKVPTEQEGGPSSWSERFWRNEKFLAPTDNSCVYSR